MGDDLVQHSKVDNGQKSGVYFPVLPVAFAEDHAHVNVLEIKNTDSKVCTENTGQENEVPLDVLEHEDNANHV